MSRPLIPIGRPLLGDAEAEAVARVLRSGWVAQGPEVLAFESEFAALVGAPHACAVSSGTTALHLALHALGVGPGDEVVTLSHSFIATANSVRYCGATPVFVDVAAGSCNVDPALVERALGPRTRAILCVHQLGMPCDLPRLRAIADARGLPLVEDAACALGSAIAVDGAWEPIGRPHGRIACFSFHPRKTVTTGDGGMLTTADAALDARFRLLRQHAISLPNSARHAARVVEFESYPELGYNYRLTDIQAAIGREQLKRLPGILERRRAQVARYRELLRPVAAVTPAREPEWARSNWQSFWVRLPEGCDQKRVLQAMLDAGVSARRGVTCAHREDAYRREPWSCGAGPGSCGCAPGACRRLVESERSQDGSVLLPLFHDMTDAEQSAVVEALEAALQSS